MDKFTNYSADIQEYYRRFTAGGFGESRLTFYDDEEISNLPEEVKNSSLACGNPLQYLKSAKIPDNAKILDLGCGGGFELVRLLNEINPQLAVGLDYSPQMIARCHTNLLNHTSTSGACMQGNGEFLPFKNASFDFVISNAAINLIPDKEKTFKEIRRVLKPDGRLFFSDVTIHVELPDKVRKYFSVLDGLYFAPTLTHWKKEITMVQNCFESGEILRTIEIIPDKNHIFTLVSQLKNLTSKERKYISRALQKVRYRMIEVEAKIKCKGNKDPIQCICGTSNVAITHQVINLDSTPILFSRYLNQQLNQFVCVDCGLKQPLPVPILLISEELQLKATVFPEEFLPQKELFKQQLPPNEECFFGKQELLHVHPELEIYPVDFPIDQA